MNNPNRTPKSTRYGFWKQILLLMLHLLAIPLLSPNIKAQTEYTLQQVVRMAQDESVFSKQAENRKLNSYWQFRLYESNYRPQLSLSGELPSFNRSFSPVTQPDGTTEFQPVSISNSNLTLSLRQTIAATGGEIFVNSRLQRFDDFDRDVVRYNGSPVSIGFRQPIFGFNELKWDKRIEPLRYEESLKRYTEEMEMVALEANDRFFRLLLAQVSLRIAKLNQANNDTIYRIAEGRYSLGKIAENDLLQLELNLLRSQQQVTQAQLDLETAMLQLNTFLGQPGGETLQLVEPNSDIPDFDVPVGLALEQAKGRRQQYLSMKRRRIEAERDVARAKGESGLNVDLFGSFGLTQRADDIPGIYQNPQDQQSVRLGFSIPIVDWGRQKARIQTATANRDLVSLTLDQEQANFEQEIFVKVKQFPILRSRLIAGIKADDIAQRRYEIAQKRYLVAKISITDLNIALQEKDQAKQQYLEAMRAFWNGYYELRMLTLYDFEKQEPIGGEDEEGE